MHSAVLSWTASVDVVDGYNVYRSNTAGTETTPALNGTTPIVGTTFTDSTVVDGDFFYVVRSVKGGVESINSNEVEARVLPAPPTSLVVVSVA